VRSEVTSVAAPAEAHSVFGSAFPQAERYAALLAEAGVERGVLGPGEAERIWDRHLLNSAAIAYLVPHHCTLADLGSGAGLPGLVLAMLRPEAKVTLIEPMARRVTFLEECVAELSLENVTVVRARGEELAGRFAADVVTARAVAPLEKLARLAAGLVRAGGVVLAMKGAGAEEELVKARPVLAQLGISDARIVHAGDPGSGASATVVRFTVPRPPRPSAGRSAGARGTEGKGPVSSSRRAGGARGRGSMPNSRRSGG
jgi:16S rRNA (guanine527-N7)-methyltransferase